MIKELCYTVSMINDMLEMQKELDKDIFEKKGIENFSREHLDLAIIDEIGELTHELKGAWCWWKKTQKEPERELVLGELVDVWHFVLMKHYKILNRGDYTTSEFLRVLNFCTENPSEYTDIYTFLSSSFEIDDVIALTYSLNFNIKDVYNAYIEKNKINHQRAENGY